MGFTPEQQVFVDDLVGKARVKAREKATSDHEAAQAKAKDVSDQAALVAEKKWQELAERHEARVRELLPLEVQAKAYSELVAGMLKDKVKALGDAAKKAIGALPEGMSALEKLNWLNENEALFKASESGAGVGTPQARQTATPAQQTPVKISRYPLNL